MYKRPKAPLRHPASFNIQPRYHGAIAAQAELERRPMCDLFEAMVRQYLFGRMLNDSPVALTALQSVLPDGLQLSVANNR